MSDNYMNDLMAIYVVLEVRDNGVKEWSVDGLQESYETIGGQSDATLLSAIECCGHGWDEKQNRQIGGQ